MPSISLLRTETSSNQPTVLTKSTAHHRGCHLEVLFVHLDAGTVDGCLQELKNARFKVTSDVVLNLAQCAVQLRSKSYDVIVVEYPSPSCKGSQMLQLLDQTRSRIPLVVLVAGKGRESIADIVCQGAFECVELEHIRQLPMAVRRLLNERKLRLELEEAERALRHSRSLYRALLDNPTYGICRCDAQGKFLEVNKAFLAMLGYESEEELLRANRAPESILNLCQGEPLPRNSLDPIRFQLKEVEWNRKDGTLLKARLSGHDAFDEYGDYHGREFIVVDITEQRGLEDQLRYQASSDSLTGLGNRRRLIEVLQAEIGRSKRTGREISLVMLDLDGLKYINDQFGHATGDRALCRLAQIMKDCSRSIDTVARYGGDEFALVLPETCSIAAALVAQRICESVGREPEKPLLSVSVGMASYPGEANTIETLLRAADKALYAMKNKRVATPSYAS
jgi:diguanylate cyclase (GGDEF)-like protein/PAS domain S-box-containing protein